jgi:RNA polymerase sigma-70 factor (family 1)
LKTAIDHIEQPFLSFQQGEEAGFNHYFHLYYKPLLHFAFSILHRQELAEDVTEESFIKLWSKKENIISESAIKPYLYASVRNACIDVLRKERHINTYKKHIQKAPVSFAEDDTQKIITSEAMHQVYLAVQNLPSKYKQIFNMLWVQGKEVKDISLELNLPLSTVKSQKARALELLKKQLPHLGILLLFFSLHMNS